MSGAMRSATTRQNRSLYLLALLWALFLLAAHAAEGGVQFPPVPEAPDLAWNREPFLRDLPQWNMDAPAFPWVPAPAEIRKAESDPDASAAALFREARRRETGGAPPVEIARLYLRAYAAAKNREIGYTSLKQAARFFFRAGDFAETAGILDRLIDRSGAGSAGTPFYLFKGEALARRGNFLAARECFRRASAAAWDTETRQRIALRIADMSFLLENMAFAEPMYRKTLSDPGSFRRYPRESIRYGEALLSSGKIDEAQRVFRKVREDALSPEMLSAALLGEGDALLLRKDFAGARFAYEQAGTKETPLTRWWVLLRKADLEFLAGGRESAARMYGDLGACPLPAVAREALYKTILARFLLSGYESVLDGSRAYLSRFAGEHGEAAVRKMAARAGAALVAEAGRKDPASRWPLLAEYLFAYGRSPEGKTLYAAIGGEWESALLWGGASALFAAAGNDAKSREMLRIETAERLYWQGDLQGAAAALDLRNPSAEPSGGALRLLAKIRFREGRYDDAAKILRRIETSRTAAGARGDPAPPRAGEFPAFVLALQGKWTEALDALQGIDPAAAPAAVRGLRALAETRAPRAAKAIVAPAKGGTSPAPNDLYSAYARSQERYRRIMARGDD
jgi:predicted negative regulator of RcsB-dependent stress response